jgi:hypothetical protein
MRLFIGLLCWLTLASSAFAFDLRIASFNTESDDDTQPAKVAESIAAIGNFDILAVQEVESSAALVNVVFPEAAYCDKDTLGYSDHRPLLADVKGLGDAVVEMNTMSSPTATGLSEEQLENMESALQTNGRFDDVIRGQ